MNTLRQRAGISPLSSGAAQLVLLTVLIAIINASVSRATELSLQEGLSASLAQGGGQSWIIWCSLLMAAHLIWTAQPLCSQWYLPIWLWPLMLLILLPLANTSWLAAIILSLVALIRVPLLQQKAAAAILLALSLRVPSAQAVFLLFSEQVLSFDAWLASGFVALIHDLPAGQIAAVANVITGPDGMQLLILTGCSAFTNLSLLLLLWFSINRYCCWQRSFRQWWLLVPIVLASLLTNTVRLGMMSFNQTYYEIIHNDWGATVFDLAQLLLTLLIAILGVRYEQNRYAAEPAGSARGSRSGVQDPADPKPVPTR